MFSAALRDDTSFRGLLNDAVGGGVALRAPTR